MQHIVHKEERSVPFIPVCFCEEVTVQELVELHFKHGLHYEEVAEFLASHRCHISEPHLK